MGTGGTNLITVFQKLVFMKIYTKFDTKRIRHFSQAIPQTEKAFNS